jgi:hypothetical protein
MKTMTTAVLLCLVSTSTMAHEKCNIELEQGIRINPHSIEFVVDEKTQYEITASNRLLVAGEPVPLTVNQQQLVNQYSQDIRGLVPIAQRFALDGVDLAVDGVSAAFNELLGPNHAAGTELLAVLAETRNEVDQYFTGSESLYFNPSKHSGDDFFSHEFEQRVESAIESSLNQIAGALMITLGQEVMSGGLEAFGKRMDAFGQKIETEMKGKISQMEMRGQAFCESVVAIDRLEEDMKANIAALHNFEFIKNKHAAI